jgi:GH15 family glucan-1,4-alpha-glucosidase
MALRIEDYALIGDCHTAALVGRDGSIDWACLPRFDSGACFAALLGTPDHGRWQIVPTSPVRQVRRRYRPGTLILETEFETEDGTATLIDFMPPRSQEPDIIRLVVGQTGCVKFHTELIIRFDYGSIVPWVRRTETGLHAIGGPDSVYLDTDVELHGRDMRTVGDFEVAAGEERRFVLMWHPSHERRAGQVNAEDMLDTTEQWWHDWSKDCRYAGPHKELVLRSLITLKALTYHPTGGIVAAPTTSLPEQIGGPRNWDYRFCWLRDATFTLYALLLGGFTSEAAAWREWLLRAIAGSPSQLNIMYGLCGERRLTEVELPWLPGYENALPVRVGNAAYKQFQLDVFGEVCDALHQARRLGLKLEKNVWAMELELARYLQEHWRDPDEGIWEIRGPRQHFVHSKVMAWVAFDRLIHTVEQLGAKGPVDSWRKARDEIHREVCERGFDAEKNSFVQHYGTKELDASLLMIPLVGFLPESDPRVVGTVEAIERELLVDGFVLRYRTESQIDGLPPGEGAFLPCSFWLVDNLVAIGRRDDGEKLFERLVGLANDLGLLSEEYDPHDKRLLGNFPQAFTHVALVNSAFNLWESRGPTKHRQKG